MKPSPAPAHTAAAALLDQSKALAAFTQGLPPNQPLDPAAARHALAEAERTRGLLQAVENALVRQALPLGHLTGMSLQPQRPRFVAGVEIHSYVHDSCGRIQVVVSDVETWKAGSKALQTLLPAEALANLRPWPADLSPPAPIARVAPAPALPDDAYAQQREPQDEPQAPAGPDTPLPAEGPAEAPKPAPKKTPPAPGGNPPAAGLIGQDASGSLPWDQRPATDKQQATIRNLAQQAVITPAERAAIAANLPSMTRASASKTIDVLGHWVKHRPLTAQAAPVAPAAPNPVYHLAYRWRHTVSPKKAIQAVFTPPDAQSFAHAYEQFLDYLQATTAEAKSEGYQPNPVLIGVNGVELSEPEWEGHLRDATLAAVDQAAETGCPPEWPEGHNPENYTFEPSALVKA